jgi:hypothetical protein
MTFPFTSNAAHKIGRAAFFDPLIFTVPDKVFHHFTLNNFSIIIKYIYEKNYTRF